MTSRAITRQGEVTTPFDQVFVIARGGWDDCARLRRPQRIGQHREEGHSTQRYKSNQQSGQESSTTRTGGKHYCHANLVMSCESLPESLSSSDAGGGSLAASLT